MAEEKPVTLHGMMTDETKVRKDAYLNYVSYLFNKYDVTDDEFNKYLSISQSYVESFCYDTYEGVFEAGLKADEELFEERLQEVADVLEIVNNNKLSKLMENKDKKF